MCCRSEAGRTLADSPSSHSLSFARLYTYPHDRSGITLPVALRLGSECIEFTAKLDTGAEYCIFQRELGENLGVPVEDGEPIRISSANWQTMRAFGHELTLEVLGFAFHSTVFFAEDEGFRRNVLGRNGWLNRHRIAIVDYEQKLYIDAYQQE